MKKIITLVAVLAMTLGANAQIVSSSSRSISSAPKEGYNRVYAQYAPTKYGDMSTTGFAAGYAKGISLTSSMPLFVEAGGQVRFNSKKEDGIKFSYLAIDVPVNVTYRWDVPNVAGFSIAPYAGLRLTGNIIGQAKAGGEKISFFDEDDMKEFGFGYDDDDDYDAHSRATRAYDDDDEDDYDAETANRIQFGMQLGVNFNYKMLTLGVGYSLDFNDYIKGASTKGLMISVGYNF